MKKLITIILFLAPFVGLTQDLKEYKAGNGKTYKPGDTVMLGLGSNSNGGFSYVQVSQPGFLPPRRNDNSMGARRDVAKSFAVIKRIKVTNSIFDTGKKTVFIVKNGGLISLDIYIEEAIAACEVTPCASSAPATQSLAPISVADELAKLKKLLDSGAITQAEYDAQKKKLLAL